MLKTLFRCFQPEREYAPRRRALARAGLREEILRAMKPDERVEVLERAGLDPYDYIFLCF